MMKKSVKILLQTLLVLGGLLSLNALTACGSDPQPAVIEDTPGGLALIEREFGECEGEVADDNVPRYLRSASDFDRWGSNQGAYPHDFSSLGEMYPLRGSFRQSKAEIMDIIDRHIWSQERGAQPLLDYFDMTLLINVSPRDASDPENSSAQSMQVLVRRNSSNNLQDWERVETWPISSGIPCGRKIATPTGVFKFNPERTYPSYYSRLFDNVDMYETMFLYHHYQDGAPTGVAIHGSYATTSLGRRASGGCIRLHRDNAQCLYETIHGLRRNRCLSGGLLNYRDNARVPSLLPKFGEADPEYLRGGRLEMDGISVLVAIFNDREDRL
jgi:hypothetical protein